MTGCGSCGACKFLRRKCSVDCVFAPYFSYDQASSYFAAVHKVFGASNASRLLSHLPLHNRSVAASTISYEALARVHDPIYGCVAHILALQQEVASLQEEIDFFNLMANSTAGVAGCGSSQALTNSNNGIEFSLPNYQNQLANQLPHEGSGKVYQSLDGHRQMDLDFTNNVHGLEDHLFGESNPNPLDKLLYGIDQEAFLNHPWFNHT